MEDDSVEKKGLKTQIALIARTSIAPKLSQKAIVMMPYGEFIKFIKEWSELYGVPAELDFLEQE